MGWDAFATRDGETYFDGLAKPEFASAAARARKNAICVDGLLYRGGLDISHCGLALQEATGRSAWSETSWSPDDVRALAASADWSRCQQEPWAVESARAFLEVCAEHGFGVTFSF